MIRNCQKTLYGVAIEECRRFDVHYTPIVNTTLNEKFNVKANYEVPQGKFPTIKAYAIGVGGGRIIDNVNEFSYSEHGPLDAALFKHVPFIMRKTTADLSPQERANYRMRTIETIGSEDYVCYYLKLTPTPNITDHFYVIKTLSDGTSVSNPTISILDMNQKQYLNPEPKTRLVNFKTQNNIDYVTKINKLPFTLTEKELEELNNVFKLKGIDTNTISEVGICSGVDVDAEYGKELVAAQIYFHVGLTFNIESTLLKGGNFTQIINLGGLEPLLG